MSQVRPHPNPPMTLPQLDEKEADICELEHMLLNCNRNTDITPVTSTKSLLYRISKVENRLAKINAKFRKAFNHVRH